MNCEYCLKPITKRYVKMHKMKPFKINDNPNPQPKDFAPEYAEVCEECCNDMGVRLTK
jgi:hypothetical protein